MAKIIIPSLIALIFQCVMMFITIKTKFATSEADAMKIYKRVLFILSAVLQWLAIAYLVWLGIVAVIADSPMTARGVLWMLIPAFVIFHSYMMLWFWILGRYMEKLRVAVKTTAEATINLIEAHERRGG